MMEWLMTSSPLAAVAGQRKAKAACQGATSIRQAGMEVVIYLYDGMAYDLEPLAAVAGQRKANVACSGGNKATRHKTSRAR
ncbi:hypothetical protein [Cytobacillus praedii]|uniref:hypothetical protein n=1 Tax=Cytobacillus praedii TaxID=1742358 RepID=UPI002E22D041|nr:hypothetical protein [Cytobacillus praedii]